MPQNCGKNLDPPPKDNVDYIKFVKKWDFMAPPPGPNLGKNWNVDYFEIFAPPLILAKSAPKLLDPCKNSTKMLSNCYNETISFIYQPYMYQILPISHLYITYISSKSSPYFSHLNLGNIWKSRPPPCVKIVYILNCGLFDFQRWPPPSLWTFPKFWDIFNFDGSPKCPNLIPRPKYWFLNIMLIKFVG